MTDIRVAAEQARVALQCICSHGSRTPREIDADWDFARAALASLEAALAALPGDKEPSPWASIYPALPLGEQVPQIAGRDGASAAPSDEGSAHPVGAFSINHAGEMCFHRWTTNLQGLCETLNERVTGGPFRAMLAYAGSSPSPCETDRSELPRGVLDAGAPGVSWRKDLTPGDIERVIDGLRGELPGGGQG